MKHCLVNQSVQGCSRVNRLLYACGTFSVNESHWCNTLTAVWWVHYSHTNKCWPACYIMSINHTIFLEETCYNTGMGTSTSLFIWLAPSVLQLLRNVPCYNICIHRSSSTTPSATTTTVSPYILFATRFSIYRMNIDGSEKQLVVREPAGGINAVNYHYRYGYIDYGDHKIIVLGKL